MTGDAALIILLWIRSGPTALFDSRFLIMFSTSGTERVIGGITVLPIGIGGGLSSALGTVDWLLK